MSLRNRPEYVADVATTQSYGTDGTAAAAEVGLVNRIPLDKPIFGLLMDCRYRAATGATTAPGTTQAEGDLNFIQRVRVVGTHKRFGQRELVNLRGSSLYELEKKYSFGQALPKTSNVPAAGVNPATGTNYDVLFTLYVPLVPRGVPKLQQILFLVRNDEWATFDLYVTFGDATAIWNKVTNQQVVFTDYASASGTPKVRVSVVRTILGNARQLIQPAVFRRQFLPLTSVLTAAALTDSPIQDLDVGFKVLAYLVKCGVQNTTASSGVNAYSSLSDAIITRPKVKLDNVTIKDAISPQQARAYTGIEFGPFNDAGYIPLEFCEGHDIQTAFRGDMLNRSNKLQLAGDVAVASNQSGEVIEELIEGEPSVMQAQGQ